MLRSSYLLLFVLWTSFLAAHSSGTVDHARAERPQITFDANKGQWPAQVRYRAMTPGGALFVEPDAFTHVLVQGGDRSIHGKPGAVAEPLRIHAYRVRFSGATTVASEGVGLQKEYVNYFLGNDPSKWASEVPVHAGVRLKEVYPGVDLSISGMHGLKYDWVVAPGADPNMIALEFEGLDAMELEYGLLHLRTSAGDVIEQRPVAWQEVHGRKEPVAVFYRLEGDRLTYHLPNGHDPRYRLVIDPVVTFCSYSGSNADNFGTTATYDDQGHLYGAGTVFGIGYPTTMGVLQGTYANSFTGTDMGVTKFSPDGSTLIWSTYLGGTGSEVPHSMVTNAAGELYIMGTTGSSDFPVSNGCFDPSFNGGQLPPFAGSYGFTYDSGSDIVVAHLNADATGLVGSTYVGGTGNDGLNQNVPLLRNYGDPFRGEIIVNAAQEPIIATSTASSGMFTTPSAIQTDLNGALDGYAFRMDPTLSTMLWATYYGGSDLDNGLGVQVSSTGDIYLTGGTQSTDIITAGTPFSANSSGGVDGYIARFNAAGDALLGATYIGTLSFDQSYFVQLGTTDEVFVVGQTSGPYPVSPGVYANPGASQFIHKLSADLSTSIWSTRIGGTGNENISPSAFLVSVCDQIYFSGWGGSTNPAGGGVAVSSTDGLPVSPDAYQATTDGSDFYLIVLEPDASGLAYATFFGGSSAEHVDGGTSRFDKDGIVYQAVCAGCSGSFPTTPGAWSNTDMGQNCNLGVFKINFEQGVQAFIDVNTSDLVACLETPFLFTANGNAMVYTWDFGDGSASEQGVNVSHTYAAEGSYDVMLIGTDEGSCNVSDTAFVTVTVVVPADIEVLFDAVPSSDCNGASVDLTNLSTGSDLFYWDFGDGSATSTAVDPVHPYDGPGTYDITLAVIDPTCPDTTFLTTPVVIEPAGLDYEPNSPLALCDGQSVLADAGSGYDSYLWSTGSPAQLITITEVGDYTITVTEGDCVGTGVVQVFGMPEHTPIPDATSCNGSSVVLVPTFEIQQITWSTGATTPTLTVEEFGTYWFNAIDVYGCPVTDTVEVFLVPPGEGEAIIPNVFTPNGDGQNDTFEVTGIGVEQFSMEIYDRWGMKMYETVTISKGWNGGLDNANSNAVPDGTYYYIIDLKDRCSDEPQETKVGHVTLLR